MLLETAVLLRNLFRVVHLRAGRAPNIRSRCSAKACDDRSGAADRTDRCRKDARPGSADAAYASLRSGQAKMMIPPAAISSELRSDTLDARRRRHGGRDRAPSKILIADGPPIKVQNRPATCWCRGADALTARNTWSKMPRNCVAVVRRRAVLFRPPKRIVLDELHARLLLEARRPAPPRVGAAAGTAGDARIGRRQRSRAGRWRGSWRRSATARSSSRHRGRGAAAPRGNARQRLERAGARQRARRARRRWTSLIKGQQLTPTSA